MEITEQYQRFTAPEGESDWAGASQSFEAPKAPYDLFMEREGLPVHREIGFHDVRELALADWPRTGGRGAFLQLLGTEGMWGMHLLEIPPGGAIAPERHIYEEVFFVVEGHGTTEVWADDESRRARVEWQSGSMFAIPLNAAHRIINATRERALLLVGTTAPIAFNTFPEEEFIFANPYRFDGGEELGSDYFSFREELYVDPHRGRAMQASNFIPDVVRCDLPLDNQRSPGYRRIEARMGSGRFYIFVGQHEIGRYSKAHYHRAGAVLICISGKGYSYTWPRELGPRPFAEGHGDQVLRQAYVPGGMIAAAPSGGDWFHQHFGIGTEPIRLLVFNGLASDAWAVQAGGVTPGQSAVVSSLGLGEGGRSIDYPDEDPYFREEYARLLAAEGVASQMGEERYRRS